MDRKCNDISIMGEEYERQLDIKIRKEYGRFYTPDYIIDYVIDKTLSRINVVEKPFVKVLDPSCGSGYFLVKAKQLLINKFIEELNSLRERYYSEEFSINYNDIEIKLLGKDYWCLENIKYHVIKHCIFGSDIDGKAVEIAKANLCAADVGGAFAEPNIICCDSLIRYEDDYDYEEMDRIDKEEFCCNYKDFEGNFKKSKLNIEESKELKEICSFWKQKYDYIIGNPPWVSLSRKHKGQIDNKLLNYYIDRYDGNRYLPNLYEFFIKRSLQLLKFEGEIGFVIPDRFAHNLQHRTFREYILRNYNIKNLTFKIKFPGINTDPMIFIAEKKHSKHNEVEIVLYNKSSYYINQRDYIKNVNCEFLCENSEKNKKIREIIENESDPLGDISETFTGFIGDSNKITKNKLSDSQMEIIKGKNIKKYKIINSLYYEMSPENIKGGTKNISKLSTDLKIVIRKTGNNIFAALDVKGYIIEQSLYGLIELSDKYLYKYVLAILNSKLIHWYYQNFLITNVNSTPQIKKYDLNKIPIKKCDIDKQLKIVNIVDSIMEAEINNRLEDIDKLEEYLNSEIFSLYEISFEDRENFC